MEMKDNVWATDVDSLIGILKDNLEHLIKVNVENLWKEIDENIKPKVNELWEMTGSGLKDLQRDISKIESHIYSAGDITAIEGDIKNLHKNMDFDDCERQRLARRVEKLESIIELAFKVESFKKQFKAPHKCPICEGKAIFSHCFPGQSVATSMDCKSCKGEGIVWG